jgi:two-component system, cell cycle sensor histidine kinase and response regulator CckA
LEAVEVASNSSEPIHLLLTDLVMPGMSGRTVADKVSLLHPGIPIAYMSGYTGYTTRDSANLNALVIAKPFTRNMLLQKLSEALELERSTT